MPPEPGWLHRHSLGLFVVTLFLVFLAATLATAWPEYVAEQADHGAQPDPAGFWVWYSFELTMSLIADIAGFALIVFSTKRLREIGSAESK
jgi:hypothetical protein